MCRLVLYGPHTFPRSNKQCQPQSQRNYASRLCTCACSLRSPPIFLLKAHLSILIYRGGGIGGLTLAVALSRLPLDERVQVDIYESTDELTQIGAGITLCPRGWEIIRDLSLDKDLADRLAPGETSPDCKELSACSTFSP
jgi:hypothetical protein